MHDRDSIIVYFIIWFDCYSSSLVGTGYFRLCTKLMCPKCIVNCRATRPADIFQRKPKSFDLNANLIYFYKCGYVYNSIMRPLLSTPHTHITLVSRSFSCEYNITFTEFRRRNDHYSNIPARLDTICILQYYDSYFRYLH